MLKKTVAKIFYWIGFSLMILGLVSAISWYASSGDAESRTNLITTLSSFVLGLGSITFGFLKSTEPIREYNRQLQKIRTVLRSYKAKTALDFLKDSVNAIESNENLSDNQRKILLAEYRFTEAKCLVDIGVGEEVLEMFLKAYKLNPKSGIIKGRACTSYYALEKKEKAKELANEILKNDEFNHRALVVKCLLGEMNLDDIPSYVQKNEEFLNIYLNFMKNDDTGQDRPLIEIDKLKLPENINYDNLRYWCFCLLYTVERTPFSSLSLVKSPDQNPNIGKLKKTHELCSRILSEVKETDLYLNEYYQQFETIFHFLNYALHDSNESIISLYKIYKDNSKRFSKGSFIQLITNLSQIEEFDKILELCSDPEIIKDHDLEFVIGHTYVLKGNIEPSIKHFNDYLEKERFGIYDVGNFRVISRVFKEEQIDVVEFYDSNMLKKVFESESIKVLCKICFYSSDISQKDYCYDEIEKLLSSGQSFDEYVKMNISILLYELGYHDRNVSLLRTLIDKSNESHGLYLFIKSLYLSSSNHQELLDLLKHWRESQFSSVPLFYWYEVTIYLELRDYEKAQSVAEIALKLFGYQGDFLFASIYSLYRLKRFEELEQYLDPSLLDVKFTWNQIGNIASICLSQKKTLLGLKLMYPKVKETSNRTIRMQYFGLVSTGILEDEIENLEIVTPPCLVRIKVEKDEIRDIEIQEDADIRDDFYEPLIGNAIGDKVVLKAKNENIEVEVINVFNKHQALHLEITKEFHDNLEAKAYGVKTIEGGNSPEDLINQIIDAVGDDGYKRKVSTENSFELYKQSKLSLGNLIRRVNINKAFQIVDQLMLDNVNGYNTPPLSLFKPNSFDDETEFVVDFSSLFGLIKLSEKDLLPTVKLLVSRHLVDYLDELLKEESNPNSKGIISATLDSVNTHFISDEERNFNIEKVSNVINWIQDNCEIAFSPRKLDLFEKGEERFEISDWHQHYMMDNLVLASESNRFLITDDAFFYETAFRSIRMTSLEFFMIELLQNDEEILTMKLTLLEINYNGLTINHNILNEIYDRGPILESSGGLFNKVLKNLPYYRHQNATVLFEIVKHAKYIYSHSISIDFKKKLCQTLFVESLKGYPYDRDLTNKLMDDVNKEFDLLGDARLSVLDDITVSLKILGLSNQ